MVQDDGALVDDGDDELVRHLEIRLGKALPEVGNVLDRTNKKVQDSRGNRNNRNKSRIVGLTMPC